MKPNTYNRFITRVFKSIFILLIPLLSCNNHKNNIKVSKTEKHHVTLTDEHKNENVFRSLDGRSLLTRLFDNPTIDKNGTAIWSPNYYERMIYPVSYDGKCHTAVDTTMFFTDEQNRKCAVVILTTYNLRYSYIDSPKIDTGDCHFCGVPIGIALFSQNKDNNWEIYAFRKEFTSLGYFGAYRTGRQDAGKISLKKIGDNWTALSMVQGVGGNGGELSGNETLYSIEQYLIGGFPNDVASEILNYTTYYESTSPISNKVINKQITEMKLINRKKTYYDIDLVINTNRKIITEHLRYSDNYNKYVEK